MDLANKNLNTDLWLMRRVDYPKARALFRLKLRFISAQHAIQQAKQRQIRENLGEPSTHEYSTT